MSLPSTAYAEQLGKLLPPGRAWTRSKGSRLDQLTNGLGIELARVDRRGEDLLRESDPRTTSELLVDWERALGLPDPCTGPLDSVEKRRTALVGRLIQGGGQSRDFYVQLAAALGYTISIVEHRPPWIDEAVIGDELTEVDEPPVVDHALIGDTLADNVAWAFTWDVIAEQVTQEYATVDNAEIGDPLSTWGNGLLECTLGRLKPAHTHLRFLYIGVLHPTVITLTTSAVAMEPPFLFGPEDEP